MLKSLPRFVIFGALVGILTIGLATSTIDAGGKGHHLDKLVCNAGQVMVGIMYSEYGHNKMSIICQPDLFAAANMIPLHFEQKGIISVPADSSTSNLVQLATWEIIKDPQVENNAILGSLEGLTGHMKRTVGGDDNDGDVVYGFFSSIDGVQWRSEESFSTQSAEFVPKVSRGTNELIQSFDEETGDLLEMKYLSFGVHSSDNAAGEIKDVSGTVVVTLPVGYSIQLMEDEPEPPIGDEDNCDKKWKKYYHDGYENKWKSYDDDDDDDRWHHDDDDDDDSKCPPHHDDDDDKWNKWKHHDDDDD